MKTLRALFLLSALIGPVDAATLSVTPGSGTNLGMAADGSGNLFYGNVICGSATLATLYATIADCAIVNAAGQLSTTNPAVGATGSAASAFASLGGVLDGAGNLQALGPANPMPIVNPAVGLFGGATPAAGAALGASGAGGLLTSIVQAGGSVPISISTATTTQLVALAANRAIYVTSWDVLAGGAGTITFEYGTGTACATGTVVLTGPYGLTAQVSIGKGSGLGPVLFVPASNALCAVTSAAVQLSGALSFSQF